MLLDGAIGFGRGLAVFWSGFGSDTEYGIQWYYCGMVWGLGGMVQDGRAITVLCYS